MPAQPQELDDLQHDPATLDTLWKLVEIPFMHQAKVVLKFVKKIPGESVDQVFAHIVQ